MDEFKAVVEALEALNRVMGGHNIIGLGVGRGKVEYVQLSRLENVPTTTGTIYKIRNSEECPVEKSTVIDGMKFLAIGTKEDMAKEFNEVA